MKLFHTYPLLLCLTLLSASHISASTNAFTPMAPLMKDYAKTPTFISESEKPSTMLILDSSGSMQNRAYRSESFTPGRTSGDGYYGYFDPKAYYSWNNANNYFIKCVGSANSTCDETNAPWSGDFMNWLTMRRVDVAKKVLTGGRVDVGNPAILIHHADINRDHDQSYNDGSRRIDINGNFRFMTPYHWNFNANFADNGQYQRLRINGNNRNLRVLVHPNDRVDGSVEGLIQKNGDDIRFGLTIFDTWDGDTIENGTTDIAYNGGEVQAYIGSSTTDIVNRINSTPADSWTPLAETLYTVTGVYAQDKNPAISSTPDTPTGPRYATDSYSIGNANDPFYFSNKSQLVPCSKAFVILITDGEPTQDTFIPNTISSAGTSSPFNHGGGFLENVAYWAHTTDLRPDLYDDAADSPDDNNDGDLTNDFDDQQNLILYTVYAFGSGTLLRSAAINGSFIDKGAKDGLPNSQADEDAAATEDKEWDFNDDGEPDNYAEASDGKKLEEALSKAMNDILRTTSSGTASSVISSSRRGEGAAFQALFMPEYLDQSDNTVQWIGDLNAMFKDDHGNLREDTNGDGKLDFAVDRVARIFYSGGKARVNLYIDADGDGRLEVNEDIDGDRGNAFHPIGSKNECDHNEDLDFDGWLDVFEDTIIKNGRLDSEDIDCDRTLDRTEDVNGNGVLDRGEDLDHDGHFDNMNEDYDGDCVLNTVPEDIDGDGVFDINEDFDGDGVLNPGEDRNRNGILDPSEDINNNGILDPGEDIYGNGLLDLGEDSNGDGIANCDLATEDINGNGICDPSEDINNNGVLDSGEDIYGNGLLDLGEDVDGDGVIDLYEDYDHDGKLDPSEDTDGDGILDINEDHDGDGLLGLIVEDLDGDGHLDTLNEDLNGDGNLDINEDHDGDGVFDLIDEDLDGDGHLDIINEDHNGDGNLDINEDLDGDGNLDVAEDLDGDGRLDIINEDVNLNGILDPGEDLDGDGHLDLGTEDIDGDGHLDVHEDHDGDGNLDLVNEDLDGDGHLDTVNEDLNGDGNLDINEDLYGDGDGVFDLVNEDIDGDGHLDTINEDLDGDGILDINEDFDGDGILNTVPEDLDGDGRLDVNEDIDGDGILDINEDFDGDGILNLIPEDIDGDGVFDINEDLDGDGRLDNGEDLNCNGIIDGEDVDHDCRLDLHDEDVDRDGILDYEEDVDQDGICDTDEAAIDNTVDLLNMRFLWSAGKNLSMMSDAQTTNRTIITSFDDDGDGTVEPSEEKLFTRAGANSISAVANIHAYFNLPINGAVDPVFDYDRDGNTAADTDDLEKLIDYIRGIDDSNVFRSRFMRLDTTQNGTDDTDVTWRLGDIVNSSPISVQKTMENFDLLYNDNSYRLFAKKYLKRRHVLYVGSNDGMLRAFNGGFYDKREKKVWRHRNTNYNPYDGLNTNDIEFEDSGDQLGDELWAYIPYNLLPHLQWLARKDYEHVYYVDQQVRIADVKIFDEEMACSADINDPACVHPEGWGTILIGGMRFGGGPIAVDEDGDGTPEATLSSAYFVLDITNPENDPDFLGEFTFDDFSFTTSNPTVIQMKNSLSPNDMDWYLAFGTGPTTLKGQSDERGKVYIMKLNYDPSTNGLGNWITSTDTTLGKHWFGEIPEDESFLSDMISVDFEIGSSPYAFMDDAIYFGSVSGGWNEEDRDGDGTIDTVNEDRDGDGQLDAGEDTDGDGNLDIKEDDFDGDGIRDTGWSGALYRIILNDEINHADWLFGADIGSGIATSNSEPFLAIDAPITAAPGITIDFDGNFWVYVGTGRYLDELDDTDQDTQYILGVMEPVDSNTPPGLTAESVSMSDLLNVTFSKVYEGKTATQARVTGVAGVNTFQQLVNRMTNDGGALHNRGWKRELTQSLTERIISSPLVYGGAVFTNSYAPNSEICSAGGYSWAYALYYLTGTAYYKSILGSVSDSGSPNGEDRNIKFVPGGSGKGGRIVIDDTSGDGATKINIQSSTGAIQQIETETPLDTDSGKLFWKNEF